MAIIRQVIKARDIQNFFGKKERQSFKMIADMRKHFVKKPFQPITVGEFCEYYGVKPEELNSSMTATDESDNLKAIKRKTNNNSNIDKLDSPLSADINPFQKGQPKEITAYVFSKKEW